MSMSYKIIRNAIQCAACGSIVESVDHQDFKWCSCPKGSVSSCAAGGGNISLKRIGNGDWIELSQTEETECEI